MGIFNIKVIRKDIKPEQRAYLEHKEDGHYKFYEVMVITNNTGNFSVTTRYGKIGTKGSYGEPVIFESLALANRLAGSIVVAKKRKGYKPVNDEKNTRS